MNMETFLLNQADSIVKKHETLCGCIVSYRENVNPYAIDGDKWLETNTSFIWKVGVLSVADGNKRDWCLLFMAQQRSPEHEFEFIGKLEWSDGENDDPGRCLRRMVKCSSQADILYEDN